MMQSRCKKYYHRAANSRGLTLIEVIASLLILGTLVSSVAISRGRSIRQMARADLTIRATAAADRMVSAWLAGPSQSIPLEGAGTLPDVAGCTWKTQAIRDPSAARFNAVIVRLTIFDSRPATADQKLFTIEMLVPQTRGGP